MKKLKKQDTGDRVASLEAIADPYSRILILGTAPGPSAVRSGQYFAHPRNQFWKLLYGVFGAPLAHDYQERKLFLASRGIALWEVLKSCERHGSADSAIRNIEPNDPVGFLESHPNITRVFFDSKAAALFHDRYFQRLPSMAYFTLPSPSPAYASLGFHQKLEAWKIIRSSASAEPTEPGPVPTEK